MFLVKPIDAFHRRQIRITAMLFLNLVGAISPKEFQDNKLLKDEFRKIFRQIHLIHELNKSFEI